MKKEELNLVELLKGKERIELWSPIAGKCTLLEINRNPIFPIVVRSAESAELSFASDGRFTNSAKDGECLLFPSEQAYRSGRGWQGFDKSKKLVIANAADYKPMYHWVRGIEGASDEKESLLADLIGDTFSFTTPNRVYYRSPISGSICSACYASELKNGIMTEFIPEFVEAEEEWQPKDLELVYAWNGADKAAKILGFYDAENKCLFYFDGFKDGPVFENYAPCYDQSHQEWAKEARKLIKEIEESNEDEIQNSQKRLRARSRIQRRGRLAANH